jgi:outer membrane lipopolysaccharide assembly protein LptE/RlpB
MNPIFSKRIVAGFLFACLLILSGCGYELVREHGVSGGEIVSLNVPVFKNRSLEPQVPAFFTEAFSRELLGGGAVDMNKTGSDTTLQGTITSVLTTLSSLSSTGLAVEKIVTVSVSLALTKPNGSIQTWALSDSETYDVSNINLENFNREAALQRIAARIARRFHAQLISAG